MIIDLKDILSVNDNIAKSASIYAERVLNSNDKTVVLDLYDAALLVVNFTKSLVDTITTIGSVEPCSLVLKNTDSMGVIADNLIVALGYDDNIELIKNNKTLTININPTSLCDEFKEGSFKCIAEKALSSANSGLDVCDIDIAMYYSYFAILNMLKEYLLHIKKYSLYVCNKTSLVLFAKFSGIYSELSPSLIETLRVLDDYYKSRHEADIAYEEVDYGKADYIVSNATEICDLIVERI